MRHSKNIKRVGYSQPRQCLWADGRVAPSAAPGSTTVPFPRRRRRAAVALPGTVAS